VAGLSGSLVRERLLRRPRAGLFVPPPIGESDVPTPEQDNVHFVMAPTRLEYSTNDGSSWAEAAGTAMRVPDTNRVVHTVELTSLPADGDVSIRLPDGDIEAFYTTYDDDPTTTLIVHWQTLQPIVGNYHTRDLNTSAVRKSFTQPATLPGGGWRVVQMSDSHGGSDATAVAQAIAARDPRLVIHSGDVATGNGGSSSPNTWYSQFDAITELVDTSGRHIPFIPNIGNHEMPESRAGVEWHVDLREGGALGPPKPDFDEDIRGGAEWYYSFFPRFPGLRGFGVLDFGDYFSLFVIDPGISTFMRDEADHQVDWITSALAARTAVPHKIATMHYSPWPAGLRPLVRAYLDTRRYICAALYDGGCRLIAVGHDHVISRTVPLSQFGLLDHQTEHAPTEGGLVVIGSGPSGAVARNGRNANGKWWLEKTQAPEIVFFSFEETEPDNPERFEPRFPPGPKAGDGQTSANADVVHFWEIDLAATERTMRARTLSGTVWDEFTQPADEDD
jgi:hypothetical protein